MFKNKRYDPKPNRMADQMKPVDILPCSHTYNNQPYSEDTPIKLLSKNPCINLGAYDICIPSEKKNAEKELENVKLENERLR